jgi:hypothetical protein
MIENSTELMACIDEIEPPETKSESGIRIAILTYPSPGILNYAAYAFAVTISPLIRSPLLPFLNNSGGST